MCGIAGIWWKDHSRVDEKKIHLMTDSLEHRGPDAEGQWSSNHGLFLGHRRLSIVDLEPRSNQPFIYIERYVITFNGEIYNYLELKEELLIAGYCFITNSDTEVLCAAYNYWGVNCLSMLDGMFSFVIYDKQENQLFCARDRFGEKPFYYTEIDGVFYFASEMKALWKAGVPKKLKDNMVYQFLVNDLVEDLNGGSGTFFQNIYKLQSSHYFLYQPGKELQLIRYYEPSIETTFKGTFEEAVICFENLFQKAIKRRLSVDVLFASSLSGGIDSSAVAYEINSVTKSNVTLSARFREFSKDEGEFIDLVNEQLETSAYSVFVDGLEFEKQIDDLIFYQEEPFQSGSVFAQYKVYELARKHKRLVVLDGQGADELLGGYFKYLLPYYLELPIVKRRRFASQMLVGQEVRLRPSFIERLQFISPNIYHLLRIVKKFIKGSSNNGVNDEFDCRYRSELVFKVFPNLKQTLKYNLTSQGLEKLLRFSDRNSMAHSVEARMPFLSHELVDFVLSLPSSFFFRKGWTKAILRNAMDNKLSEKIIWRKDKIGFEAPHSQWLKTDSMQSLIKKAKEDLVIEGWITNEYNSEWKILVLWKILKI